MASMRVLRHKMRRSGHGNLLGRCIPGRKDLLAKYPPVTGGVGRCEWANLVAVTADRLRLVCCCNVLRH
jgi:hypothetical protein